MEKEDADWQSHMSTRSIVDAGVRRASGQLQHCCVFDVAAQVWESEPPEHSQCACWH